ncbi:hypothetical protein QM444_09975 [Streptococcus mitis]|uniref:hypothetical protein n=1 Tax=Streptococcus mitis TaxID=28037 RepID=UPI0039C15B14
MVEYRLRDILSEINGTNWYWIYRLERDNRRTAGRVNVRYYNGALLINWNVHSLRVRFGDNPPLSFSDTIVAEFENDMIIIRDSDWEIYLDTRS